MGTSQVLPEWQPGSKPCAGSAAGSSAAGSHSSSGPSGSGKSTLLYLLGALDRPTSGEILVEARTWSRCPRRSRTLYRRDQIGFIFQSFNLISNLTALENVLVPFLPGG